MEQLLVFIAQSYFTGLGLGVGLMLPAYILIKVTK